MSKNKKDIVINDFSRGKTIYTMNDVFIVTNRIYEEHPNNVTTMIVVLQDIESFRNEEKVQADMNIIGNQLGEIEKTEIREMYKKIRGKNNDI